MEMEEIKAEGRIYTWANNKEVERFVEEKLDRFFGSGSWLLKHPKAKVIHVEKQTSDHKLLILVNDLEVIRSKKRFSFDQRWLQGGGIEDVVEKAWKHEQIGSLMYQVYSRIVSCRVELLK